MTAPTYWIIYDDRPDYLLARVEGLTDSLEVSIAFWQEIALEVYARKPRRLLVHESFRNSLSAPDMVDLAAFITDVGFQNIRLAFVDSQREQLPDNRIAEEVLLSHGLIVKVFADLGEAERWLLADVSGGA